MKRLLGLVLICIFATSCGGTGTTSTTITIQTHTFTLSTKFTPVPSETLTPAPTLTEAATATSVATATESLQTLNPSEMQENGIHGVLLDARGSYQGITQNVSVGITPDINEALGGNGAEFNDKASTIPVGDRLAEASLRSWYQAYLDRNKLQESAYSFDAYIKDYKSGKDMSVAEWVYDPATKTSSVEMVGPGAHVTYVSEEALKWYGEVQIYMNGHGFVIEKSTDGLVVVVANSGLTSNSSNEQKIANIDSGVGDGMQWLYQPLEQQNGNKAIDKFSEPPESIKIINLIHPGFFSNWTVDNSLVTIGG